MQKFSKKINENIETLENRIQEFLEEFKLKN